MSITSPNLPVMFSPFHAILQDGIDRLLELVPNEEFTFIVKGERLKTTLCEAVLISPIISERLKIDPMNREFSIESDEIEMKQFLTFVDFIRTREEYNFSREEELAILSICKMIGNERLSLLILESVHCGISNESKSSSDCESGPSRKMSHSEKIVESCASQFNSYSTEELRALPKQILHSILSSPSLFLESEDSLLQRLIDLGSDYFEYWCYIELIFLSREGISQVVEKFPFEELSYLHWEKIVSRLVNHDDESLCLRRFGKPDPLYWQPGISLFDDVFLL
jgi:hypothetical protein